MDKIEKYKAMEKILREIEDLKNSETAVIKKIGQVETENMNVNADGLDAALTEIYDGAYKNLENIEALHVSFTEKVSDFKDRIKLQMICCLKSESNHRLIEKIAVKA